MARFDIGKFLKDMKNSKNPQTLQESGERFEKLKNKLSHEKGIDDPAGLAASIGRKKYGKKEYQHMAAAGKKHEGTSLRANLPSLKEDEENKEDKTEPQTT